MDFRIEPKALAWLKAKGRDLVVIDLEIVKVSSCACSRMLTANLTYREPADVSKYQLLTVDGIRVYLPAQVNLPDDRVVTLKEKSTLGFKSLKVEGLSLEKVYVA